LIVPGDVAAIAGDGAGVSQIFHPMIGQAARGSGFTDARFRQNFVRSQYAVFLKHDIVMTHPIAATGHFVPQDDITRHIPAYGKGP
jgi:hypothetical protein